MDCNCEQCAGACANFRKNDICENICVKLPNENVPSQFGSFFLNGFHILLYFTMYMLLFWFKITDLLLRLATYLHSAERSVKLAAGVFLIILFSSIFIDTIIHKTRKAQILQKHDGDSILIYNYNTPKEQNNNNNFAQIESVANEININVQPPELLHLSPPPPELQNPPPDPMITRIFTLIVTDEKNNRIFKTSQKIQLPINNNDGKINPVTIILTDPNSLS